MADSEDAGSSVQALNWQSKASANMLMERALMLRNIRAFFDAGDVLEVETPLMSRFATTDPHLDSFQSSFRGADRYLNTSPEYAMKRLLVSWNRSVYQICKAFRDDELGKNHNPEFTLLEWYRPGFDMRQLMTELEALVKSLCASATDARVTNYEFTWLSYQQAFEDYAGFDPHQISVAECYQAAIKNNIEIPQGMTLDDALDDWLDWLLTQMVLPAFDSSGFTFLYDYPASQCSLAKITENQQGVSVAKRFELFFGEIELANGFHELTDADEQLRRFKLENSIRKQNAGTEVCIDINFIAALHAGLPECSGVALGLDRFLMVLTGAEAIEQVLSFAWDSA